LRRRLGWLPVVLAAAAIPPTQRHLDRTLGEFRAQDEVLYLWSGKQLKRLVPGFEHLAADIYWLRTVQYFGGRRVFAEGKNFDLLYPLVDITTTLDPRLEIAYRYGAIFLAEGRPVGAGRPRDAVAILERGAQANPNDWRLRNQLGFFYYLFLKDPRKAAEVMLEASRIPGSAYWLKTTAADILGKGGERAAARAMWRDMYEHSPEEPLRNNAKTHLTLLDAADGRDRLQKIVDAYERVRGRRPKSLDELQAAGIAPAELADPSGVRYEYDPKAGTVKIAKTSPLWRMGD
jgi:tetratricopeptide (TPR) repeat protein